MAVSPEPHGEPCPRTSSAPDCGTAREERGLTLREVAAASEGSFQVATLSAWERGERRIGLASLMWLADHYGVPVGELLQPAQPPRRRARHRRPPRPPRRGRPVLGPAQDPGAAHRGERATTGRATPCACAPTTSSSSPRYSTSPCRPSSNGWSRPTSPRPPSAAEPAQAVGGSASSTARPDSRNCHTSVSKDTPRRAASRSRSLSRSSRLVAHLATSHAPDPVTQPRQVHLVGDLDPGQVDDDGHRAGSSTPLEERIGVDVVDQAQRHQPLGGDHPGPTLVRPEAADRESPLRAFLDVTQGPPARSPQLAQTFAHRTGRRLGHESLHRRRDRGGDPPRTGGSPAAFCGGRQGLPVRLGPHRQSPLGSRVAALRPCQHF